MATPTQEELEAVHCWEPLDRVPGRPAATEFRRRVRYHQARWREAHGHPIGTQPIVPRPGGAPARLVGSRLPLDHARATGANFLSPAAVDAARRRTSVVEAHQSFDHQGLWADLLSSSALAFNLFADAAVDLAVADRVVHALWPDAPGRVAEVRFAHSPGRLDDSYLGNLMAFDVAFVLHLDDGTRAIVAVDTKYHERLKREQPKPTRLPRYLEVTARSGAFTRDAVDAVNGTDLLEMWLEHLLLLAMLQHPKDGWTWGRHVVVHPAGNPEIAGGCARYRDLLADTATFSALTLEDLLGAGGLPATIEAAARERYVPS